jgi:hypothetical protein
MECKKRFIPRLEIRNDGGPPRIPIVPTCTGCGSMKTCGLIVDDPLMPVEGDVPLPKWPPN